MTHVEGVDDGAGFGVYGKSERGGWGGRFFSDSFVGVVGLSRSHIGVEGWCPGGIGVSGESNTDVGVYGGSNTNIGVYGRSKTWVGVSGESNTDVGVYGGSNEGRGVYGWSNNNYGVYAFTNSPEHYALYAGGSFGFAANLDGDVYVRGRISKVGGGFNIDHPLDPANKYLSHSFVESPDMKNVYDGVVTLDDKGEAEIELPDWFSALNKDFRYQLTAIGAPGPNLYIAEEISDATTNYSRNYGNNNDSRFKIAGGTSGMKVSWQVTGIRKDPWANAHRIEVEEDKPDKERGYYMYPDLYGQPEEKGISRLFFPKEKQQLLINENKLT